MELLPYLADIIAICILVFAVYLPRHHRRDLAVAYLGVNIGVMAVSIVLVNSAAAAGLGLGLFGVLSIIRLRSDELAQHEVVYYFSALALGLLGGLGGPITTYALMGLIVAVLAVVDTSRFRRGARREVVNLDRAITDPEELRYGARDAARRPGARCQRPAPGLRHRLHTRRGPLRPPVPPFPSLSFPSLTRWKCCDEPEGSRTGAS